MYSKLNGKQSGWAGCRSPPKYNQIQHYTYARTCIRCMPIWVTAKQNCCELWEPRTVNEPASVGSNWQHRGTHSPNCNGHINRRRCVIEFWFIIGTMHIANFSTSDKNPSPKPPMWQTRCSPILISQICNRNWPILIIKW